SFRLVRRAIGGRFEANGGIRHGRSPPAYGLLLPLLSGDCACRGARLLGNGARCNRVLRDKAENLAILMVGDEPDRAFLIHLDIADAAAKLGENELVLDDFAASD